jgi:S-DNA-T family DNA segregation ATPase FtsK/SpoIIIE
MKLSSANLFEIGSVCVGIGAVVLFLMPAAAIPASIFIGGGVAGMITYFFDKSKFDILWRNLKLGINESYPILKREEKKGGYTLHEFTLPSGLCLEDFKKHQEAIEQFCGNSVEISYGFKNLIIKEYDAEKTHYTYEPTPVKHSAEIITGYNRVGKMETVNLAQSKPHMLLVGMSGSGKSTALRAILTNIILNNSGIELFLGDLKNGVELNLFEDCEAVKAFAKTRPQLEQMLRSVESEMYHRYELFEQFRVRGIEQYNKRFREKLPYQLVVIDEFADLTFDKKSASNDLLLSLSEKARAAGIYLLLCTQRPDKEVLSGRIRANICNKLCLLVENDVNSKLIIGHGGLEKLRGLGHGVLARDSEEIYIQCPDLDPDRAEELLRPYYVSKPKAKPEPQIKGFDFLDAL